MSKEAHVIGMGRFKKGMEDILDYSPSYYEDMPEGTPVVSHFFHQVHGEANIIYFCEALGLGSDPYDFTKHYIESESQIDYKMLAKLATESEWGTIDDGCCFEELERFGKAMELGMKMILFFDF